MTVTGKRLVIAGLVGISSMALSASTAMAQPGWGPTYYSSTVQEGAQRGFADVIRSKGQYNLDTAQAASTLQDAASKYLDNRMKATDTYFQMRQANAAYRKAEAIPALSSQQLFRLAAEQAPKTLTSSDLDPLTGDITWPLVLQEDIYTDYRTKLQKLFDNRHTGSAPTNVFDIQNVANEALATLKSNISAYPAPEYLKAKKFLESLAFTARVPYL